MVGAEDALLVGQQLLEQAQGLAGIPAVAGPGSDVVPGGERVGVVGAEDALLVGQQLLEQAQGLAGIPAVAGILGDVVPGGERVRVVGAEGSPYSFVPSQGSVEVLCGRQQLSSRQALERPGVLTDHPQMLRLSRCGIAMQRISE